MVRDNSLPEPSNFALLKEVHTILQPGNIVTFLTNSLVNGCPMRSGFKLVTVAVGQILKKIVCVVIRGWSLRKRVSSHFDTILSRLKVLTRPTWRSSLATPWKTKFVMGLVGCWTAPNQTTGPFMCPFWRAKQLDTTRSKLVEPTQPTRRTSLV